MYIFEVLNPEGFVERGEKLNVTEHGPFVYRMRVQKLNVTYNYTEDTATYREYTTYEFDSGVRVCVIGAVLWMQLLALLIVGACLWSRLHQATFKETGGKFDSDNSTKFTVVDSLFWGERAQVSLWCPLKNFASRS